MSSRRATACSVSASSSRGSRRRPRRICRRRRGGLPTTPSCRPLAPATSVSGRHSHASLTILRRDALAEQPQLAGGPLLLQRSVSRGGLFFGGGAGSLGGGHRGAPDSKWIGAVSLALILSKTVHQDSNVIVRATQKLNSYELQNVLIINILMWVSFYPGVGKKKRSCEYSRRYVNLSKWS